MPNYTLSDLEKAFNAGRDVVIHDWHISDYHTGQNCVCNGAKPNYHDFESWFKHSQNTNK